MAIELIVPRLGWSMEEGAFVAWLKTDGEFVRAGDPLFSIEGDKAIQEIESIDSGILRISPNAPRPGDSIRVGDVLGHLLTADEAASIPLPGRTTQTRTKQSPGEAQPVVEPSAIASPLPVGRAARDQAQGTIGRAISPRALRVAAELGVDWTAITGSGRTGRVRERDIRAAAGLGDSQAALGRRQERKKAHPTKGAPAKAVFFGELLMRLATRQHQRFVQAREFDVRYTGAEANAAVSLANFGLEACVVSAVPDHELGQACINYLRQHGVNADHIARGGTRLGTFYLEIGAPPRPTKVIYDRAGSAFCELKPGNIDWDVILAGRQWFHWSGTAPALSPSLPAVVAEACVAAKRLGLRVSCDLNYRSKLWSAEAARAVMTPLMGHVDVLIGNEEHIATVLGVDLERCTGSRIERCTQAADALRTQFNFSDVAITMRESNEAAPQWQGLLANQHGAFASRAYPGASVDRIGAGDAFSGALIYGMLTGMSGPETIEFATAAGCLKHSIHGDFNLVNRSEVLALVRGDAGHRVQQ